MYKWYVPYYLFYLIILYALLSVCLLSICDYLSVSASASLICFLNCKHLLECV